MQLIPPYVSRTMELLRQRFGTGEARAQLRALHNRPAAKPLRISRHASQSSIESYWDRFGSTNSALEANRTTLADTQTLADAQLYAGNIENMIGTVKLPVGVVGPLRVNGLYASGDYFVPLATTEAALVASYGRGADVVSRANGVSAALISGGVLRTPGFAFIDIMEAGQFIDWIITNVEPLRAAAESTSRFAKLIALEPVIDTDIVFLQCRYTTGDASGQNMVTIATDALCRYIEAQCPIKPRHWFIESNFSGDKKASYLGVLKGRGRKVTASACLSPCLRDDLENGSDIND